MNRRTFLLSSAALAATTVLPKLAPAAPAPSNEVIIEVLRIDGVWREVSFRALSKGDIFRRRAASAPPLDDEAAVWIATSDPSPPTKCSCVSKLTGRPLSELNDLDAFRRSSFESCNEPWGIQVEQADPAVVAAREAAKDEPFPAIKAYASLCNG